MKSVLISIQPKWCELIASGKKTVEVRKTRPKLETPFKCYIYCTKDSKVQFWTGKRYSYADDHSHNAFDKCGNGKVIGEFVCDRITEYECSSDGFGELATTCGTCLTYDEIINYCNGNSLYAWHISDLVIYDKPRELSEFRKPCIYGEESDVSCFLCDKSGYRHDMHVDCFNTVTRPPQSWCYVEESDTE